MPAPLWRALRNLAIVRGYIRQSLACDENTLSHAAREALGAFRCTFAILQQITPREHYGATREQSREVVLTAIESLQDSASQYTQIEYELAAKALNTLLESIETLAAERGQ